MYARLQAEDVFVFLGNVSHLEHSARVVYLYAVVLSQSANAYPAIVEQFNLHTCSFYEVGSAANETQCKAVVGIGVLLLVENVVCCFEVYCFSRFVVG